VRIGFPAEDHLQQVARVVRKPIDGRIGTLQPAGEEVDRKRKSVHLGKQCDKKPAECAEGPPVPRRLRLEEAVREKDEDDRVDEGKAQRP